MSMKTEGLLEFADNIEKMISVQYPKQTEQFLKAEGTQAVKLMKALAEGRVGHSESWGPKKKRKSNRIYHKAFKRGQTVYDWNDNSKNLRIYNTAPHAHLLEDGHELIIKGVKKGFVYGKHVLKDGIKIFEGKFARDVNTKLVSFIVEKLEK